MPLVFGDNGANTISATSSEDVIFGLSGFDTISSVFERSDMRGGWGRDEITSDYEFDALTADSLPNYRTSASGDQGDDLIKSIVDISDTNSPNGTLPGQIVADVILDGGLGNDQFEVIADMYQFYSLQPFEMTPPSKLNIVIIDDFGNNEADISSNNSSNDVPTENNHNIRFGGGNDKLSILAETTANNYAGASDYEIELGNGENSISMHKVHGDLVFGLNSGSGADAADLNFTSDEGNSHYVFATVHIDLGGGDDALNLLMESTLSGYVIAEADVILGEGNNDANIQATRNSEFKISAGDENDNITLKTTLDAFGARDSAAEFRGHEVDLGEGSNTAHVEMYTVFDPFETVTESTNLYLRPTSKITTGNGDDQITVVGGVGNEIHSGDGEDFVSVGSGTDSVYLGNGPDTVEIGRSVFSLNASATQRIVVSEFQITEDSLSLIGWDIPGLLPDDIINVDTDLQSLIQGSGELLSLTDLGSDALLTLDLGGGIVGEVLLKGLEISASDSGSSDPPVSLVWNEEQRLISRGRQRR